jgi:class 3 adenylate cyclase
VIKEEDDYFGSAVVMAARIMDESAGGQILVSELVRQVADGSSNSEHDYTDFGRRTLKGFDEEEHIFEVLWQENKPEHLTAGFFVCCLFSEILAKARFDATGASTANPGTPS